MQALTFEASVGRDPRQEYFGEKKPLRSITEGDAKSWRRSIVVERTENTIRKRTAIAKTLFSTAVDHRIIDRNPFAGLKSAMIENKKRMYFVTAKENRQVLEACPSTEWQTILRTGSLRRPTLQGHRIKPQAHCKHCQESP